MQEKRTLIRTFSIQIILIVTLGLLLLCTCGQESKKDRPSPPAVDSTQIGDAELRITYSSPSVRSREIWGELVPYYEVWRTGANEATVFQTSEDLLINGKSLPAGKYALFTIPEPEKWTVIFNREWNQWGAYGYEGTLNKPVESDVLRLSVSPSESEKFHERMKLTFKDQQLVFYWEKITFDLKIAVADQD